MAIIVGSRNQEIIAQTILYLILLKEGENISAQQWIFFSLIIIFGDFFLQQAGRTGGVVGVTCSDYKARAAARRVLISLSLPFYFFVLSLYLFSSFPVPPWLVTRSSSKRCPGWRR